MTRSDFAIAIMALLISSTVLAQNPSKQASTPPVSHQEASHQEASHDEEVSTKSTDSQGDNPSQADNPWKIDDRETTNVADETFLKEFAKFNAAEVSKGELAAWKAEYVAVKAFATHVVDAHSETIGKVKTIAAQANIGVKAKPDFMQRTQVAILDVSAGTSFDRAYMKAMVNDQEKIIETLARELKDGQDAGVKQFAAEALSNAQQLLKLAQDLRAKVVADQNVSGFQARNNSSSLERLATNRQQDGRL